MKQRSAKSIFRAVRMAAKKHSPEILTGMGVAGMFVTVAMAVKATPKATRLLEEKRRETETEKLSVPETVKTCWKCYIPAAVMGALSAACVIGAHSVHAKRTAAIVAAYTLSESAFGDYRNKVTEVIGEAKEQAVRDEIAKDKLAAAPASKTEVIPTKRGDTLCYDAISGRYFKSDIERIRKAVNDLNRRMRDEMFISLNEFYWEIGLGSIKLGDELGWNIEEGYIEPEFSSQLVDDGTPCLVIGYALAPCYEYRG